MIIFDKYLDRKITTKALKRFLKENGKGSGQYKSYNEYIVFFYALSSDPEIKVKLKISDKRRALWMKNEIDLRLYLWLDDNFQIKGVETYKYKEIYNGHGISQLVELDLTQDEFKIEYNLLEMITEYNE